MNRSTLGRALAHPELGRLRRWAAVFIEFSFVQGLVQLVGFATGIAVVRLLTTHDYALYTIANTMLAALVVLSDSGIASAAVGIGGRMWRDPVRLGKVIEAARAAVRSLGMVVSVPAVVAFLCLLLKNGASAAEAATLVVLALLGGAFSLYNSIDLVVARLTSNTRFIQYISLATAGLRLLATTVLALFGLVVETAMLALVAGWGMQYWATARWARDKVRSDGPPDSAVRRELKSVVRTQFPNTLNFVFQAQMSVWLLSIFGSAGGVADLGAVTRIGVVFSVLMATMQNVVIPLYARCQDPRRLGSLYFQICAAFALLVLAPVALVALVPRPVLWILGPQYAHLSTELVLAVLSASIGSLSALAWSLNTNRAWFPSPWIWIPLDLASQLILALAIGVSTVRQVLLVAIFWGLIQLTANIVAAVLFIRRFRRQSEAGA
jgi:O-antigen/teichoic acid export membrane protein